MSTAPALTSAARASVAEPLRERVQVLETRRGVREVLLVSLGTAVPANDQHAIIVLGGGGGGFAVTSDDGVSRVHGGLPLSQRQQLANAIGGPVVAVSPPTDQPVIDRQWRMSDEHVADLQAAVEWTKAQWPLAHTWVLGLNSGALSAAVAAASIDTLAGAVLLACAEDALERPQISERMRVLAVRHRRDGSPDATGAGSAGNGCRRTVVTVFDERAPHAESNYGSAANSARFGGKDLQVVDVVARWILTGAAPDEIR
jgi:hypothetical protein